MASGVRIRPPHSPLFASFGRCPEARVRLLCLPHAGGSCAFFRRWPEMLPGVEVVPVQLPGRGARFCEPHYDSVPVAAAAIRDAMDFMFDKPFGIFGHCLGATLGFEVARSLRRAGMPGPVHLFASAAVAPELTALQPRLSDLPEVDFRTALLRLGGVPDALRGQTELLDLLLGVARADFRLVEEYRPAEEPPLSCPVTVFGGHDDHVTAGRLECWRRHATGRFDLVMLPGGHFFLEQEAGTVLAAVRERLERVDG